MRNLGVLGPFVLLPLFAAAVLLGFASACHSEEGDGSAVATAVPEWEIEGSYQDSRGSEHSFRFRVKHRGKAVAARNSKDTAKTEAGEDEEEGTAGDLSATRETANAPAAAPVSENGDTRAKEQPTKSDWFEGIFREIRAEYDWSSEDGGPDLFRIHLGDCSWDRLLGLNKVLDKLEVTGAVEMNATHNLDTLNLGIGLERPFSDWLDPGASWAHYLVLGLDLERLSPGGGDPTTHGNATVEAYWGKGWGWKRTVDLKHVASEAKTTLDEGKKGREPKQVGSLDEQLGRIDSFTEAVTRKINGEVNGEPVRPVSQLEHTILGNGVLTEGTCGTILHVIAVKIYLQDPENIDICIKFRVGGARTGDAMEITDGATLKEALEAEATWKTALSVKWRLERGKISQENADDTMGREEVQVSYWDLLAVALPAVGLMYDDLLAWKYSPGAYAGASRKVREQFESALNEESWWLGWTTEQALISYLCRDAERQGGRALPEFIFSVEAIGWAPLGGGEDYDFHGTLEPKLVWRKDGTSTWGLTASYKYGYERSTRVDKIGDLFVGFSWAFK